MKKKKSPTCKSKKVARERIYKKLDEVFIVSLKSIIASLVAQYPKEILIAVNQHIYKTYMDLKDLLLKHIISDYSVKDREKLWECLTLMYTDVLHPLIQAINKPDLASQSSPEEGDKILNYAIKAYQKALPSHSGQDAPQIQNHGWRESNILWPKPLEINFLWLDDANDVATISCKIRSMNVPYATIDTGSDSSIFSENIAKLVVEQLGLKLNRKKVHNLNGVAGKSQSIGTFDEEVPISISSSGGTNTATISDEFSVIPTEKDQNGKDISLVILGTKWQYRAGWKPIVSGEFKASVNGKTISVPLSVYKAQRNIFKVDTALALEGTKEKKVR